jgi:hypothetical protein
MNRTPPAKAGGHGTAAALGFTARPPRAALPANRRPCRLPQGTARVTAMASYAGARQRRAWLTLAAGGDAWPIIADNHRGIVPPGSARAMLTTRLGRESRRRGLPICRALRVLTPMSAPVVTRFAPSPTGFLHIGGARTALFNWLYARRYGGRMLLRIEDTDRERSTEPAIRAIIDGLTWLGLDWDGDTVHQFARAARHREVAELLRAQGRAYYCYASRRNSPRCARRPVATAGPCYDAAGAIALLEAPSSR